VKEDPVFRDIILRPDFRDHLLHLVGAFNDLLEEKKPPAIQ
jgi:hypothetical protein